MERRVEIGRHLSKNSGRDAATRLHCAATSSCSIISLVTSALSMFVALATRCRAFRRSRSSLTFSARFLLRGWFLLFAIGSASAMECARIMYS
jgi:hypothetical protein